MLPVSDERQPPGPLDTAPRTGAVRDEREQNPSLLAVVVKLVQSPRALTALFVTSVYGSVITSLPTICIEAFMFSTVLCLAARSQQFHCISNASGISTQRTSACCGLPPLSLVSFVGIIHESSSLTFSHS